MRLIITRPRADAAPLAAKLEGLGHSSHIMPLMEIVPRDKPGIPDRPYQAICITSANGILNHAPMRHLTATPLLCVGPQSAAAAKAMGFLHVTAQGGDVAGLSTYITRHLRPADGPILYLSGAATSGDLEGLLTQAGYDVDRVITYDAVANTPADLADAVRASDGVLLYSPRTAILWVEQVEKAGAQQHMSRIMHHCLSPAVAQRLPQSWRKCVAQSPDEMAMLATLNHP
jgi:uroporphyrinogen-III synthase